jgi:hypothetical protein
MEVAARTINPDLGFMRDPLQAPLEFSQAHNGVGLAKGARPLQTILSPSTMIAGAKWQQ